MCVCPYYDAKEKKCTLWKTYQDAYAIRTYCMGPNWDSYTNCPNYKHG